MGGRFIGWDIRVRNVVLEEFLVMGWGVGVVVGEIVRGFG